MKKITLNKETVRKLDEKDLKLAGGGLGGGPPTVCDVLTKCIIPFTWRDCANTDNGKTCRNC